MKKKIQLVALDLDGTLLQNNGQISEYTKQKIHDAVQGGVTVVISTGRPYVGLPLKAAEELGIRYAITTNGAGIYEIPSKKCLKEESFSPEFAAEILQKLLQKHLHLDAFINGEAYTQTSTLEMIPHLSMPESTKKYILKTRTVVPDLPGYIVSHGLKLQKSTLNFEADSNGIYIDRKETKELLESYSQLKVVSGGYHNLEFTKAGISKAAGLHFLCDYLHIPVENTMVCGDTQNDLDILEAAGFAVAMGNATEEIKAAADYVTSSCDEDGVGRAIAKFVLG